MLFSLVGMTLVPAEPAAAANIGPAPLLSQSKLQDSASLYYATPAQQASLATLEQQAVANTVADHGLPSSDKPAAQTWGRPAAEGELYALLVQAINTSAANRTPDQANVVAWLTRVAKRQDVLAADDAGLEYAKWAGLGAVNYENLLAQNPTETQLQNFLSTTPRQYTGGEGPTTPKSQSNDEGFCVYVPPAPYSGEYTSNIYGSTPSSLCYQGSVLGCVFNCSPPTPSKQEFVSWGAADANQPFRTSAWAANANSVGESAGFGIAVGAAAIAGGGTTAVLSTALSGLLFEPLVGGGVAGTTTIASALVPFGGVSGETYAAGITQGSAEALELTGEIAAADIGAAVGIVLTAVTIGVIEAINVFSTAALPGQLAQLISAAQTAEPDLASILNNGNSAGELFALFVGATLPLPTFNTASSGLVLCSPVCLNAPAIPPLANTDPTFTIQGGAQPPHVVSALQWKDQATETTNSAYITGHWFVNTESSATDPTSSLTVQTLAIHYTDWSGHEQMAWLTGDAASGYLFVTYRPDTKPPVDPATCLSDGLCSESPLIFYVGPDGHDYAASVSFGRTVMSAVSASGPYRGKPTLTAKLTTWNGGPLANETVAFSLDNASVGNATTNNLGVATLTPDVTLSSSYYPQGTYPVITATFTPAATDSSHLGSSATGELTVTPGSQTITVGTAPPTSAVYGTTFTVRATASSGLAVSYGSSGACSNTGDQFTMTSGTGTCSVTMSQDGSENVSLCAYGVCLEKTEEVYKPVSVTDAVTAEKAPQTITFDLSGLSTKTYGDSFDASGFAHASSNLAVSFSSATPSTCSVSGSTVRLVGAGTCTLVASQPGNEDYLAAPHVKQSFTVAKASLHVGANDATMTYGGPVPTFGATVTGLANGDTFAGLGGSCAAAVNNAPVAPGTPAGTYPGAITCSGVSTANYIVTYTGATLTIKPAPLSVAANDQSVQYSDLLPTLTTSVSGFVLGQNQSLLSGAVSCTTTADVTAAGQVLSPAGPYAIDCSGNLSAPNYKIAYVPGTLTVSRENTVVDLSQHNPSAVSVATSGPNKGVASAMTFTGRVTAAADGHYGDISKAVPVTLSLVPVDSGKTVTADCAVTRVQPGTATSPGFEDVSCQVAPGTPVDVYGVTLSVGGLYYEGSANGVLTVYDPAAGSTSGTVTITNPHTGAAAQIAYSASYLKNGTSVQGKFLYVSRDAAGNVVHVLKGDAMSTLAITPTGAAYPKTAGVTGRATLDGVGGYSYILTAVDHDGAGATGAGDRIGLRVVDASGNVVADLTFDPVTLSSGDVSAGG